MELMILDDPVSRGPDGNWGKCEDPDAPNEEVISTIFC